ncbi:MAG TPA: hypothetical protein VF765_26170 [Polyangiaceae bacterium]
MNLRTSGLIVANGLLAFALGCGSRADLAPSGGSSSAPVGGSVAPSCAGNGTPLVLATDSSRVIGLAVDASNVYWLDAEGNVMRVSKCGGPATTLANAGAARSDSLGAFTTDATSAYWVAGANALFAVPLSGGTPVTLAPNMDTLGLTVKGAELYSVSHSFVVHLSVHGGTPSELAASSTYAPGLPAADDANVYWVGEGVFSAPRAGGTTTTLATARDVATGLAIDDANVYWCDSSDPVGPIMRTPKAGGPSVTLATHQSGAAGFATDGHDVYWTIEEAAGAVVKVAVDGGSVTTLASATSPGAIAVDDTGVYWAESEGAVMRLSAK